LDREKHPFNPTRHTPAVQLKMALPSILVLLSFPSTARRSQPAIVRPCFAGINSELAANGYQRGTERRRFAIEVWLGASVLLLPIIEAD